MKQWYMIIDVAKCNDCNNCFMACKDEHVGNTWPGYTGEQPRHGHRWLNIERRERGQYPRIDVAYLPVMCQHCENASCIEKGGGAVSRRNDGLVMIDMDKAIGNRALVDACPYGAIYWNEELNVPQKCTMCAHLLDSDEWMPGLPRCVHTCPTGALVMQYLEPDERDRIIVSEGLEAYRSELGTKPHILYKNLYRYIKNFITAGILVDGDCFEDATVVLKNNGKAIAEQKSNCFGDFKFDNLDSGEYTVEIDVAGKKWSASVAIGNESINLGYINV